jgi:translation elongation factor Tu
MIVYLAKKFDLFGIIIATFADAQAGDTLGALLRNVKRNEVRRGMIMAQPGTLSVHDKVKATIYILKKEEGGKKRPLLTGANNQLFSRTFDIQVQVTFDGKDMAMPGENLNIELKVQCTIDYSNIMNV